MLSLEQQRAIHRTLGRLVDEEVSITAQMRAAGFAAFDVLHEYRWSFCYTDEERCIQSRYEKESAKYHITSAPVSLEDYPFLAELDNIRIQRNGCPTHELAQHYPSDDIAWRYFLDPISQNLRRDETEAGDKAIKERRSEALRQEGLKHKTGWSERFHDTRSGRSDCYRLGMERYARPLGFMSDSKLSTHTYPVYAKHINDQWALCWVISDMTAFLSMVPGILLLDLQLRSQRLKGEIKEHKREQEWMKINVPSLVSGFSGTYMSFEDLDQLETIIKAHFNLYKIISDRIDSAISETIKRSDT